jgi:catechol 2,3-dioxygenase-like lactoylglutathione lyase family enzyme
MKRSITPLIFRVLFGANDLAASQRFYEALLATPGRAVGGGRVYFDCGPTIFALVDKSAEGTTAVQPVGEALYFSTVDLESVHQRARALGCLSPGYLHGDRDNPLGEIVVRPWGERSFYAADPSGNPLCFVDSRTLFTGLPRPSKPGDGARSPRPRRS